jgi:hypothetical protein
MSHPDDDGRTADHLAILNLLSRYANSVTGGDLDDDEEFFTSDAVVEIGPPVNTRIYGAPAIASWRRTAAARLELLVLSTYSAEVRFLGADRAEVVSQSREMIRAAGDASSTVIQGIYTDSVIRAGNSWRFAHRVARPLYTESGTIQGSVPGPS